MAQQLILFDFDGTLTTKDSMIEFIRFVRGGSRLYLGYFLLSPVLVGMKVGLIPNDRAKERLLAHHLKGMSRGELSELRKAFTAEVIPGILRPAGMQTLRDYQAAGDRVCLVSASLDLWLTDWATEQGVELISTQAAWEGDHFTGRLANANCHGAEKVRRVKAEIQVEDYARVIAYGDSSGDTEMLAFADEGHYQPFR